MRGFIATLNQGQILFPSVKSHGVLGSKKGMGRNDHHWELSGSAFPYIKTSWGVGATMERRIKGEEEELKKEEEKKHQEKGEEN